MRARVAEDVEILALRREEANQQVVVIDDVVELLARVAVHEHVLAAGLDVRVEHAEERRGSRTSRRLSTSKGLPVMRGAHAA